MKLSPLITLGIYAKGFLASGHSRARDISVLIRHSSFSIGAIIFTTPPNTSPDNRINSFLTYTVRTL